MTFEATPRQCAIDNGRGQCPQTCEPGHVTCERHRDREPALLGLYQAHVDEQNAQDDAKRAEAQAVHEWRVRAGIEARAKEIAATLAAERATKIAEKQAAAKAREDAADAAGGST